MFISGLFCLLTVINSQTIGHQILELERQVGATDQEILGLDCLLETAREELSPPTKIDNSSIRKFLAEVRGLLLRRGFTNSGSQDENPTLLAQALKDWVFDCDTGALMVISIAQELDVPLTAALAPRHMFVVWQDNKGSELLWDVRSGQECDRRKIHEFLELNQPLDERYYLKPLVPAELLACGQYNVALVLAEKGDYREALTCLNQVCDNFPDHLFALVLRGNCSGELGRDRLAKRDFKKVLAKDSTCFWAYCAASQFYADRAKWDKAITAISRAIVLLPDDSVFYLWRGELYYDRGQPGDKTLAQDDFNKVLELDPAFWAYVSGSTGGEK